MSAAANPFFMSAAPSAGIRDRAKVARPQDGEMYGLGLEPAGKAGLSDSLQRGFARNPGAAASCFPRPRTAIAGAFRSA